MSSAATGQDLAARAALAEYDLGELLGLEPLPAGCPAARKVITSHGSYVLKPWYRADDVEVQAAVAGQLAAQGIRLPRVVRTRAGAAVGSLGYFLQEFLPGSTPRRPAPAQVSAAMEHVAAFHLALAGLTVGYHPDRTSVWVRVTDPAYLVAELPGLLAHHGLTDSSADLALRQLRSSAADLGRLPRQLVHGDIGPDNVVVAGTQVVGLIDFTPHLQPVLFAASTALFWYHVYGNAALTGAQLLASSDAMGRVRPWTDAELALRPAGLIWEALRRLATPLELAREDGGQPAASAGARLEAVRAVVRILPDLDARP